MKLGYATIRDVSRWGKWPPNQTGHLGNAYFVGKALSHQGVTVKYLGPLNTQYSLVSKVKRVAYPRLLQKRYLSHVEPTLLKGYAAQIAEKLKGSGVDMVFSNVSLTVAYLDTQLPIVIWRDATFAGALKYHRDFKNVCEESMREGHAMERAALERCRLAIFRSDWAARDAIEVYGANPEKIKVVPTGGNREIHRTLAQVWEAVESRPSNRCKLLFVGIDWEGKGGAVAVSVATALNRAGLPTELTVLGCKPQLEGQAANFVRSFGFVDLGTAQGVATMDRLMAESHFLILPTRMDTYGNVFPEANAWGVPCLTTALAGIPSVIRNDINGRMFAMEADSADYCAYILDLMSNYERYRALALSAFEEYQSRLSWEAVGKRVKRLITEIA